MKLILTKFFTLLGLTMLFSSVASAQDPFGPDTGGFGLPGEGGDTEAKAKIISSVTSVAPGKPFMVALEIEHPGEWHSYYKNAGGPSIPLNIKLTLPEGFTHSEILWPVPHVKWVYDAQNYIYGGKAYFLTTITPTADAKAGSEFTVKAVINTQLCDAEGCQPPNEISASKSLKISAQQVEDAKAKKIIESAKHALPTSSKDIVFSAKQDAGKLLLNIKTTIDLSQLSKPIFIADSPYTDAAKKHVLTKQNDGYLLTVPLLEGKNIPANVTGIFTDESGSVANAHGFLVNFKTKATDQKAPTPTQEHKEVAPEKSAPDTLNTPTTATPSEDYYLKYDTFGDIAEMAGLVSKEKIYTLTIDQINDNGDVINNSNAVIKKGTWKLDKNGDIVSLTGDVLNKKKQTTFLWALLLIFAGGLILNLMPCVFPVLGVKVLGFVQLSGNDPKKIKMHGLVFTLGVVVSMWILAGILLAIRAFSGEAIAWGSQMQNPYFVGSMVILLALFALNLFGVFEIGTSLTSAGGNLQQKKGYQGSFFSGILTTLIATPCGAPFLATAMAYTLQQSDAVAMVLFTVFALGVAFPYLLLSFAPKLINKLPRPGNWMVTFKKSMSFLLLATCAYLLSPFIDQTGNSGIKWMLWSLVAFSTAAFIYGSWSSPFVSKAKRWSLGYGLALLFAAGGGYLGYEAMSKKPKQEAAIVSNSANLNQPAVYANSHGWKPWRPGKVDHSRTKGRMVWVDYTASW